MPAPVLKVGNKHQPGGIPREAQEAVHALVKDVPAKTMRAICQHVIEKRHLNLMRKLERMAFSRDERVSLAAISFITERAEGRVADAAGAAKPQDVHLHLHPHGPKPGGLTLEITSGEELPAP